LPRRPLEAPKTSLRHSWSVFASPFTQEHPYRRKYISSVPAGFSLGCWSLTFFLDVKQASAQPTSLPVLHHAALEKSSYLIFNNVHCLHVTSRRRFCHCWFDCPKYARTGSFDVSGTRRSCLTADFDE
jgi:hypothetical protein